MEWKQWLRKYLILFNGFSTFCYLTNMLFLHPYKQHKIYNISTLAQWHLKQSLVKVFPFLFWVMSASYDLANMVCLIIITEILFVSINVQTKSCKQNPGWWFKEASYSWSCCESFSCSRSQCRASIQYRCMCKQSINIYNH